LGKPEALWRSDLARKRTTWSSAGGIWAGVAVVPLSAFRRSAP